MALLLMIATSIGCVVAGFVLGREYGWREGYEDKAREAEVAS